MLQKTRVPEIPYLEAAKGFQGRSEGGCMVVRKHGMEMMVVNEEGVAARRMEMDACVVIMEWRNKGDTEEVMSWARRVWQRYGPIYSIPYGEDVILGICLSKEVAMDIFKKGYLSLNGGGVVVTKWEGLNQKLGEKKSDKGWIRVEGMPLHLRMRALFKQIRERFGGFMEVKGEGQQWLGKEILIKVRKAKGVLENVVVEGAGQRWKVRVLEVWEGYSPLEIF